MVFPITSGLGWYLITLKLRETIYSNLSPNPKSPNLSPNPNSPAAAQPPPPPPVESEWVVSIRGRLEDAGRDEASCPWPKLSIYRVPRTLREGDEDAYVPFLVSIGPFHRGRRRLADMEGHKWRALHHVMRRTGHDVRLYLEYVREEEERARACYEGQLSLSSDEFVECMVLDGCFLLEVLRGATKEGFKDLGYSRYDPVFAMRGVLHCIRQDMIMLENQIPLFVLDRLLALQLGYPVTRRGLVVPLILRFFDPLMPSDETHLSSHCQAIESSGRLESADSSPFDPLADHGHHCLDVFRRSLLHSDPRPSPRVWNRRWSQKNRVADRRRQQLIHCVTELRDGGIRFKCHSTDRFWDVRYSAGVLSIPRLFIHDGSKSLFLNLIAFEQCHVDISNNITSFVIFMDNLINSAEDVAYLHYCGILEHWLGDDQKVADLFNRLCREVVFNLDDSYLSDLSEKVNRYYNYRWNTWRASLNQKYFGNPWAVISLIAAVVLLLLTAAQSFYSVYAYYRPPI